MRPDHRVTPDAQDVGVAARREQVRDGHRLRGVLVGLDWSAGGDLADDREDTSLSGGGLRDELVRQAEPHRGRGRQTDRAGLRGTALQIALSLEDLEVVVDG